jgi:hypothetical protein
VSIPTEQLHSSKQLRFGVKDAATGKVSGAFKVVRGRNDDDLYVMKRDVGHHFKASWHSGSWTVAAGRQVRGFANRQWPPSVPPTDSATELVRILVPRAVAVDEPDTESDSIIHVTLDDEHEAALFRVWLIPPTVRRIVGEPGTAALGLLPHHSGQYKALVSVVWLDQVPQTPPIRSVDPDDSPRLLEGSQRPASSLTFWWVHKSRILVIADLPSVTVNITDPPDTLVAR